MFPLASQKALRWKHRRQNLLQEFLSFSPDLACLQEVDFWEETYLPALTKAGYETAYYRNFSKKHGCAIVWRKARFEKLEQLTIEYDDHGQPTFSTGNVGLLVALKPTQPKPAENPDPNADMVLSDELDIEADGYDDGPSPNPPGGILVATTHLFWRPDGSYERLRQATIFMDKVREWNEKRKFTVLIGGDFNTTPRDAAYRAMTRNEMPTNQIPDLEKWLVKEVTQVNEITKGNPESTSPTVDGDASVTKVHADDLMTQLTSETQKINLNDTKSSENSLPYPAPPTGIKVPLKSSASDTTESTSPTKAPKSTNDGSSSSSADLPYPTPPTGIKIPLKSSVSASASAEDTKSSNDDKTSSSVDLPYPAPPTGIAIPAKSNGSNASLSTIVDAAEFVTSKDPKIKRLAASVEDAPVIAPLEAFTPPRDLKASIESHPRCISIYGQYEQLSQQYPPEIKPEDPNASQNESKPTPAPIEFVHGEPTFTNYATWFKDTLDYVYLLDEPVPENGAQLIPLKLLEIPDKSFLGLGLPDENFSSDHLCLMVDFAILPRE
ncbi:hypothetical protein BGW38_009455 [Lunasporangiospora selenospora]|uniref:Endonuclease/exonuclease/phosphatase domain-containing protein n=1 Tax=Lunasporangiospora selenospora TaxID=979761 RepID=A0A9P6FX18_9FUNG|nr:hypothetical protein BGW38_009455 [Lunasporangiospora selenospora]